MKYCLCAMLLAFSAVSLLANDVKDKGEVGFFAGGNHFGASGGNHGMFGFYGAYGVAPKAQLFGEYSYTSTGNSSHLNDVQGGVKFNILDTDKYDPYAVVGLGAGHFSALGFGQTHFGLHIGGGVRIYAPGKNWGVTPEIRWGRYFASGGDLNVFRYGAGVFYQWGK
jgi:hypothetical protein